jgi:hypothetical protein
MSRNGESTNVGGAAEDVGDFKTLLLDINPAYTTAGYPSTWTQFSVKLSGIDTPTIGRLAFRYFVENGGNGAASINSDYIGIDSVQLACTPVFNISTSVSPSAAGSVTGAGDYATGSPVTVIATPNNGASFINWTESGSVVSSSPSYSFTATADRTLVANFFSVPVTVATPVISPNGGTFRRKVKFKLSCATPGATIFYTTDGSDPTTASAVYPAGQSRTFKGIKTTGRGVHIVKAMATAPGDNNSAIATATFTIR